MCEPHQAAADRERLNRHWHQTDRIQAWGKESSEVGTLRLKTRREVRMVLAIVVAWYANISLMPGICASGKRQAHRGCAEHHTRSPFQRCESPWVVPLEAKLCR